MIAKLKAAPKGYADTVIDAIGATPAEALSGPVHFGILAHVAGPLLGKSDVVALAGEMAKEGDEATWRSALLAAIETVIDD